MNSAKTSGTSISGRLAQVQVISTPPLASQYEQPLTCNQLDSPRSQNAASKSTAGAELPPPGAGIDVLNEIRPETDSSGDELSSVAVSGPTKHGAEAEAAIQLPKMPVLQLPAHRVDLTEEEEIIDFGERAQQVPCSSSVIRQ